MPLPRFFHLLEPSIALLSAPVFFPYFKGFGGSRFGKSQSIHPAYDFSCGSSKRDTEIQSSVRTSRCCETHTTNTDLCMLSAEDLAEVANLIVYAP